MLKNLFAFYAKIEKYDSHGFRYNNMASILISTEVKEIKYLLKYQFKLPLSMMPLIAPPASAPGLALFTVSMK